MSLCYHFSFLFIIIYLCNKFNQSFITFTSGAILSSETQTLLSNYPMTTIGNNVTERIQSELYSADINVSFPIKMPSGNGDTSVGVQELDAVMYDGETVNKEQYKLTFNLFGKTYSSVPLSNYESSVSNKDILFECNYRVYSPSYTVIKNKTEQKFSKVKFFSKAIFGLNSDDHKIYLISNYTNKTQNEELSKLLSPESLSKGIKSEFNDFSIIVDKEVAKAYLFTRDVDNIYCLSEIVFSQKQLLRADISVNTISCREISELGETFYTAGICGSLIYITSTHKGIQIYNINTLDYVNIVQGTEGKNIISLDVVGNFLCAIEEKVGMLMFQTVGTSFELKNTILHPKMKSVDFYVNPFYGYRFVGVLLDRSGYVEDPSTPNEFFIEFYLPKDKMMEPKVNKIFTHENNHIEDYISYDNFYFYFNNGYHNEVLIIRKGMLNSIPAISYLLTFSVFSDNSPLLVLSFNSTDSTLLPALYDDTNIFSLNQLCFINHEMYCNVKKEGPYSLVFHQLTDACESSLLSSLQERNCLKFVYYNLNILGKFEDDTNSTVGIVVLAIDVCVIIVIGVWVFKYTNGMKENRLKLVKIDKNDRKKLYLEKEEEDNFLSEEQTKRNRYETDNALRDTEQTEDKKEETILTRTNGRKKLPQLETELTNPNNVFVKRKSSSRDSNANIVKCISINN